MSANSEKIVPTSGETATESTVSPISTIPLIIESYAIIISEPIGVKYLPEASSIISVENGKIEITVANFSGISSKSSAKGDS